MLPFWWSARLLLFPKPPVPVTIFSWLYGEHQLQILSLSHSCSIVFSVFLQGLGTYRSFPFQQERPSSLFSGFLFFFFFVDYHLVWSSSRDWVIVCITKSQRIFYVKFSRTYSGLYLHHLFVSSNLNFCYNSKWVTLPIHLFALLAVRPSFHFDLSVRRPSFAFPRSNTIRITPGEISGTTFA